MKLLVHQLLHKIIFTFTIFLVLSPNTEGRSHKSSEIIVPIEIYYSPYEYLDRFDIEKYSRITAMPHDTKTNSVNSIPETDSKIGREEIAAALEKLEREANSRRIREVTPDYNNNIPAHHHHPLETHTHSHNPAGGQSHHHHHHSGDQSRQR